MKTLNCIVYLPGYGGNFIETLLMLNPEVFPKKPIAVPDITDRKATYSYSRVKEFASWRDYHNSFGNQGIYLHRFNLSDANIGAVSCHPGAFFQFQHLLTTATRYAQVKLHDRYVCTIEMFKLINRGFPVTHLDDIDYNCKFTKEYNPLMIDFTNFILGEETFVTEYTSLCKGLDQPIFVDDALDLYHDWYEARQWKRILKLCNL